MNKKITSIRLQKEQQSLIKEPLSQSLVAKTDQLTFHFCLFGLEEDFTDGFYHGVLQLPEDYPFSPPKIRFVTQNGRFQVEKPICTTFTHYHKQTWSSSWNIRTILTALISFMYSNQKGIGGIFYSSIRRRALAKKSLKENFANQTFLELFKQQLLDRDLVTSQQFRNTSVQKNDEVIKLQFLKIDSPLLTQCKKDVLQVSIQNKAHSPPILVLEDLSLHISNEMKANPLQSESKQHQDNFHIIESFFQRNQTQKNHC